MIEIGGLQKTTLIDYPGRVACTIFLISCNFRCPFCYSAELVLPEKIRNQPRISKKYLFDFLKERRNLLEGICITGGEPTVHKNLPVFIKKIKQLGYLVKLDTNGSNPEMLKKLIDKKLIDYVAMDIKAPKDKYEKVVGKKININNIEKSIEILKEGKVDWEFRTTIVSSIHLKEDIVKIAKWIGDNPLTSPGRGKYFLQNFRAEKTIDPKFEKIKPCSQDYLSEIQKAISPFFEDVQLR